MNNRRFFYVSLLISVCLITGISTMTTLAQTVPEETAVPYPAATIAPTVNSGYPGNAQPPPPTLSPGDPTPYPAMPEIQPTTSISIPIVGGDTTSEFASAATAVPAPLPSSSELMQSRLVLWLGFLIGLFILGTGIYGAIILYMRK